MCLFFKLFFLQDTETCLYLASSAERRELFLKFEISTLRASRDIGNKLISALGITSRSLFEMTEPGVTLTLNEAK